MALTLRIPPRIVGGILPAFAYQSLAQHLGPSGCRGIRISAAGTRPTISSSVLFFKCHTAKFSRLSSSHQSTNPPGTVTIPPTIQSQQALAAPKGWVTRLPERIQPYVLLTRVDKPIGTMLLYYPCTWAIMMSAYSSGLAPIVPLTYISLFGLGAFIMRGAGCTINDMWDRDLDKAVDRTKGRPLASGSITQSQALTFLGAQLSVGLAILLQLNWYSILLGASSLSLVVVYPLMKRITYWPQFVLGLAFNWGAMLGWSAVAGAVDWSVCLPLYAGSICWTLVYDTIYAHQDKTDDAPAGIRSTALLFSSQTRPILGAFSASSLALIASAGYMNGQGLPFYLGVGASAVQLARILRDVDFDSRPSCWKGFVDCGWVGILIWAGATGDYAWRYYYTNEDDVSS